MSKIIAAVFLLLSAFVFAEEGRILRISGGVSVASQARTNFARTNQQLKPGDVLVTSSNGMCQIELLSKGIILLKPGSQFQVRPGPAVHVQKGEFLIGWKKVIKSGSFRLTTPHAIVGVRGTLFWGLVEDKTQTTIACFHGKIELRGKQGKEQKTELLPGQKTSITRSESAGKPETAGVAKSYLKTFAIDGSIENLDSLVK